MRFTRSVATLLCGMFLGAVSISAHHALQAQFDTKKALTLKGELARVEWVNPHAYFWFDVKDENGKVTQWGAETVAPIALRQAGFLRGAASFRVGDTYTFEGFASRDGGPRMFASAIHFADGRKFQLWFGDASGNR